MGIWPLKEEPPRGWCRQPPGPPVTPSPIVWRVADGSPLDDAVEIAGYMETIDCGLSNAPTQEQLRGRGTRHAV